MALWRGNTAVSHIGESSFGWVAELDKFLQR
jgi:hypothetical protein